MHIRSGFSSLVRNVVANPTAQPEDEEKNSLISDMVNTELSKFIIQTLKAQSYYTHLGFR